MWMGVIPSNGMALRSMIAGLPRFLVMWQGANAISAAANANL